MASARTEGKLTAERLLAVVKQLPPAELDRFSRRFQDWSRKNGEGDDVELLARINEFSRLPGAKQQRYERLRAKCDERALTPSELEEYQSLLEELEGRNVAAVATRPLPHSTFLISPSTFQFLSPLIVSRNFSDRFLLSLSGMKTSKG